ncbi:hypothetical protein MMC32_008133 [Xylographa parallela]|nr:hypothetical protein [Xylographa parallela]
MDPLSIIASTIAILQAGGAVGGGLKKLISLKDAPAILLNLNHDAADLELVIRAVGDLPSTILEKEIVHAALERAKYAVLELEECVAYCLTSASSTFSAIKVRRRKWFSTAEDKIRELRLKLRDAKIDLITATGVVNVASAHAVAVHIENISLRTSRIESQLQQLYLCSDNISIKSFRNCKTLQDSVEAEQSQNDVRGQKEQLPPSLQNTIGLSKLDTARTATDNGTDDVLRSGTISQTTLPSNNSMFDPANGTSNEKLSLLFSRRPHGSPELLLRIFRTRPKDAEIFIAAQFGCLEPLQRILENGQGSLLDVDETGQSVLSMATGNHRFNVVQLVLHLGADRHQEDNNGCSPDVIFWNDQLIRGLRKSDIYGTFDPESYDYTDIQMALLGFGAEPLYSTISATSRANVDEKDRLGRSALNFAAMLGNVAAVEHLLKKGADPNSEDNENKVPLFYAITCEQPSGMRVGGDSITRNGRIGGLRTWTRIPKNGMAPSNPVLEYLSSTVGMTVEKIEEELRDLEEKWGQDWYEWIDSLLDRMDARNGEEKSDDKLDITNKIPGAFPDE